MQFHVTYKVYTYYLCLQGCEEIQIVQTLTCRRKPSSPLSERCFVGERWRGMAPVSYSQTHANSPLPCKTFCVSSSWILKCKPLWGRAWASWYPSIADLMFCHDTHAVDNSRICPCLMFHTAKHLGYFNPIFRLSELHQCDQEMLLGRFSWKSIEEL